MKLIVAGTRNFKDGLFVYKTIDQAKLMFNLSEIVHGGASGVDSFAKAWAIQNGIKETLFPANWDKQGRAAGPIRNKEMAAYAGALLAIWDGISSGTKSMINEAKNKKLLTIIRYY